jgi:hypothetical protein
VRGLNEANWTVSFGDEIRVTFRGTIRMNSSIGSTICGAEQSYGKACGRTTTI